MAKISTYVIDGTIVDGDKVIGSDANNDMVTKNYTIGDLIAYFAVSIGNNFLVPYQNATQDVDLGLFGLNAGYLSTSGVIIANGTEGLPDQVLTSQGAGQPAIWAYNTGSQGLASVLNYGNTGTKGFTLTSGIGSQIIVDLEANTLPFTGIQIYDQPTGNTSTWLPNKLTLEDVSTTFRVEKYTYKERFYEGPDYVELRYANYNNQQFVFPTNGGAFVMSVNGIAADMSGNVTVTPGTGGLGSVTSVGTSAPLTGGTITTSGTIGITKSSSSSDGYLSSADWSIFNAKQNAITLTTTGTSGPATLVGSTLNIPQYSGGGGGSITAVTATSPLASTGGTAPDISIQQANGSQGGYLSSTDWNTFNNKINSPLTTKGDIFVRNGSGDTRLPVGIDTQVLSSDSASATGLKWISNTAPTPTGYYGQYFDYNIQTATTNNIGVAMIFGTLDLSNGVTVVSDGTNLTKITFANTGVYNLQFSTQFQNLSNAPQDVYVWLRKNGTTSAADVTGTTGVVGMEARKTPTDPYHNIVTWNYLLDVVGGDYYQLVWATTDVANVQIHFYASTANHPSTASTLFTVTQQSGIMAGTGITAINSLTGAVQTLGVGTSGTDFAISSSGTSHTFNLPTASSTNRGALSSTDWSTFNNKQATISLTTTGSSGSSTFVSNTLNIPTYTLAGLGGQPLSTNLTSLSGLSYASTSFVKMTAVGTFALDTSAYLTSNQSITLSGDVSGTGSTSITTAIGNNKVTNAMLAQVSTATFKGRTTASTGNVEDLTATQATALLNQFTSALQGVVPASGGGTSNFLRADGTWATPTSSGVNGSGSANTLAYWTNGNTINNLATSTYPNLTEVSYVKGVTSAIQTQIDNKVSTTRTISTTAPLSGGGDLSANRTLSITQSTTSTDGYLSSTDWNTFNNKGYAINLGATAFSYLASTTYYLGLPSAGPQTSGAVRRVYIPYSGTIKAAYIYGNTSNATTTESWTLSIRLNNTTNTTIASVGNNSKDKVFSNTGLSISVSQGDYIEITTTTPAWTTAPGLTVIYGTIYIQP